MAASPPHDRRHLEAIAELLLLAAAWRREVLRDAEACAAGRTPAHRARARARLDADVPRLVEAMANFCEDEEPEDDAAAPEPVVYDPAPDLDDDDDD